MTRKYKTDFGGLFNKAIHAGLRGAAIVVEGAAKKNLKASGARDEGHLVNSITHDVRTHSAYVGSNLEYAPWVEFGTRPHFPPVDALKGWARRKLGDENAAFAIAKKIAKKGTKAKPYLRPALDLNRRNINNIFRNEIRKVFSRGR